jgi:general secretion pathway protein G
MRLWLPRLTEDDRIQSVHIKEIDMLKNRSHRRGSRRSAFTLLEILLVVGLLALLAVFVVPAVVGQGEKAKVKLAETAVGPNGPLTSAIKLFKFNTDVYPETLKELIDKPSDADIAKKWTGPYIEDKRGLIDPWSREYQYAKEGRHNTDSYDLYSMGPDGIDGNEDDVGNWDKDTD